MKAVVMCGGVGSRMRPITEVIPKPMLSICGRPIIDILIEKLIDAQADEIYLTLGYKAEQIIAYVQSNNYTVPIHFVVEEHPLGTAGSVKNAVHNTGDDVLVISGDNIFSYDLRKAYEEHQRTDATVSIICDRRDDPREYGTVCVNEEHEIVRFVEKPSWAQAESDMINTGIYFLKGSVLNMIPTDRMYDFAHDLFVQLLKKNSVFKCITANGNWGDLGDAKAYMESNYKALNGEYGKIRKDGSLITENTMLPNGSMVFAPCVIAGDVQIGDNCTIGPCSVLSAGCKIESACKISYTVMDEDCSVASNVELNGCYIGRSCVIGAYSRVLSDAVIAGYSHLHNFVKIASGVKLSAGSTVEDSKVITSSNAEDIPRQFTVTASGTYGKAFETIMPQQAMLLGMAVASDRNNSRIGVACDGSHLSQLYKNAIRTGIQSCGKTVYDFGTVFRAQRALFTQYCDLDFFICVTSDEADLQVAFSAKNCIPLTGKAERSIDSAYRFRNFSYAEISALSDVFYMEPLSAIYKSILSHMLPISEMQIPIAVECDNKIIYELMTSVLKSNRYINGYGGLLFIIDRHGEKFYAVENEHAYSYDRILCICAYDAFKKSKDVVINEEAPSLIDDLAVKMNCKSYRLYEGQNDFDDAVYGLAESNLWSFDGVFCIVKLLDIIKRTKMTLAQLSDELPEQYVRHFYFDYTVSPMKFRRNLIHDGAQRSETRSGYFEWEDERGVIRVKPDSDGKRVRVLIEADSMEISRELSADAELKIRNCSIDNL